MLAKIFAGLGVVLGLFVSVIFGLLGGLLAVSAGGGAFAYPTVVLAVVVVLLCLLCSYGILAALPSDSVRSRIFLACAGGVVLAVALYYVALPNTAMPGLRWTYWALWLSPAMMFLMASLSGYRGQRSAPRPEGGSRNS